MRTTADRRTFRVRSVAFYLLLITVQMDNLIAAFIREAHDVTLGSADKAEVRDILVQKLRLVCSGASSEFALQPAAVSCVR